MEVISVLIADDHGLIREGISKVLSLDPDIRVVGEACNGEEAVKLARELVPQVILMDLNMPKLSGLEATRQILAELPEIKVVALTVCEEDQQIFEVIKAGVAGYMLKDVEADTLLHTIKAVHQGERTIHPSLTSRLLEEVERLNQIACAAEARDTINQVLTNRELEILKQIALGHHNREIAECLCISEKTVKNHISSIFRKLEVDDRTQAALYALKNRLVKL